MAWMILLFGCSNLLLPQLVAPSSQVLLQVEHSTDYFRDSQRIRNERCFANEIFSVFLPERCQMTAYLCYSAVLVGWVYPIVVHSIWNYNGWLSANGMNPLWGVGMIDFAGSGVVHLTGGTTAIFAAVILGPRRGRFHDDMGRKLDKPRLFIGHSTALQVRLCCCGIENMYWTF
jgi:hypothetical protein